MKELTRTLVFAGAAVAAVIAAFGARSLSRPTPIEGFERVGTEFFPEFKDPNAPKSLRVAAFNEDQAVIQDFEVAFKDGRWKIPSHNDYPADAQDRLSKTAASVIGIKRDALASRRESDHEKFQVADPLVEDATHLKGRGRRITLTGADGAVLADYIIGKKVEDSEGMFYVRSPKEKETYKAKLNVSLSTKFGDWIETDLLKLDSDKLVELVIEKHSIDRTQRRFIDQETTTLTRTGSSEPWKLDGLDEATEELNAEEVRTLVNNLDDLRIIGVRPKPPGLRPDLSIDPKLVRNQVELIRLQDSLISKGFLPLADENDNVKLVSTEGEVVAGLNDGVEYVLYFGEVFTGSEKEIEVGFAQDDQKGDTKAAEDKKPGDAKKDAGKTDDAKPAEDAKKDGGPGEESDEAGGDEQDEKGDLKKSRYLLIMARFDEEQLGPAPVKPEAPPAAEEKPAETETPDAEKPGAAKPDSEKKPETGPDDEKKPDAKPEEATPDGDELDEEAQADGEQAADDPAKPAEANADETPADDAAVAETPAAKPDPKVEREAKLAEYKRELEKYENDQKIRDDKVAQGRKQADQLNKRFGEWYYVISAESFDGLRLSRKALVKEKTEPKSEDKPADAPKEDAGK